MLTAEPRKSYPWYLLPDPQKAMCPDCGVPCYQTSTQRIDKESRLQYRRCPKCGCSVQTVIPG